MEYLVLYLGPLALAPPTDSSKSIEKTKSGVLKKSGRNTIILPTPTTTTTSYPRISVAWSVFSTNHGGTPSDFAVKREAYVFFKNVDIDIEFLATGTTIASLKKQPIVYQIP